MKIATQRSATCLLKRLACCCFLIPAMLVMGCNETTSEPLAESGTSVESGIKRSAEPVAPTKVSEVVRHEPAVVVIPASYDFEPAMLVKADGRRIMVEKPGYACPTLFDLDKDGVEDLIVGQFAQGKMKWYRNVSSPDETPEYAAGEWITTGDSPAEVPGVS